MTVETSISYIDTYTSKYRYSRLYPTGVNYGKKICDFLDSDEWEKQVNELKISEMNDNRMDKLCGFFVKYQHKETKVNVTVTCNISATGKTKNYTFSSLDVESVEELKNLIGGIEK